MLPNLAIYAFSLRKRTATKTAIPSARNKPNILNLYFFQGPPSRQPVPMPHQHAGLLRGFAEISLHGHLWKEGTDYLTICLPNGNYPLIHLSPCPTIAQLIWKIIYSEPLCHFSKFLNKNQYIHTKALICVMSLPGSIWYSNDWSGFVGPYLIASHLPHL